MSMKRTPLLFLLVLSAAGAARAESAPAIIRRGNEQYRAGEFAEALKTYKNAGEVDPDSLEAKFNQGVAAYKAGDREAAEQLFREIDSSGGRPDLASAARYNLGVIESQALRAQPPTDPEATLNGLKSIASKFRGSLDLAPEDSDAARNLELTRRSIKDLREQIARAKELQEQFNKLQEQLKENQQQQQQASQQNQQRASDQQDNQQQKQEAQQEQEQVSKSTEEAQQSLKELQEQTGGEPEESDETGTPKAQRVGEPPVSREKLKNARESLEEAREQQKQAEEELEKGNLEDAQKRQEEAAESLKKALEELTGKKEGEQQDDQPQEPQPSEEQPEQQPSEQEQAQPEQQPPPEQQGEPMEQGEGAEKESPDVRLGRILEKERKDREMKQQILRQQRARNRPVEKDW